MKRFFVSADGRVRSGWVVATFTAIAVISELLFSIPSGFVRSGIPRLDAPSIALFTWPTFAAGITSTVICWLVFHEPIGLHEPTTFAWGFLAAGILASIAIVTPTLLGHGTLTRSTGSLLDAAQQLFTVGPTGIGEELLLRGIPLQALARGVNGPFGIAFTSLVFGALHLMNPDSSWVAALNVALVGAWFGALTWRTRSLWSSIGAHVAWNWFEGFIYGQPVSGLVPGRALFIGTWSPHRDFWSGGDFGPEASGFTGVMLVLAIAATLFWPRGTSPLGASRALT